MTSNGGAGGTAVPGLQRPLAQRAHRAYVRGRIALRRTHRWSGVRILTYHRVADASADPLAISPDRLRRQLHVLRDRGLKIIAMRDVYAELRTPSAEQAVALTFDDGYLDTLTAAEPILREAAAPATVFIPTGIIDRRTPCTWYAQPPPFLSWADLRDLAAGGTFDVQPHGVDHHALTALDDDGAREEIEGSIRELHEQVGVEAHTYAYAAGLYGAREQAIVAAGPLAGAVTSDPGYNDAAANVTALRRTAIFGYESDREFGAVLDGALDGVSLARRLRALSRRGGDAQAG